MLVISISPSAAQRLVVLFAVSAVAHLQNLYHGERAFLVVIVGLKLF